MFGLGMSEIILLGVLALILIGPKQLPEVARTLGRFINDLKRSAEGITDEIKKQAKIDLDLDIDKNFFEPRKKARDPDLPIPIMQDPRIKNKIEATLTKESDENSPTQLDLVLHPPEQPTFTFDPHKKVEVADNGRVNEVGEVKNKDDEKKE